MAFALGPIAIDAGYRLAAFDMIGSTSTEAMERAKRGDAGRLWIVATAQTAGHGRRGRPWATAPGNLAASLLLHPGGPQTRSATLGFAAGLALQNALREAAPDLAGSQLKLKWPNDVLVDGAKIAGILLQAISSPGALDSVVIGIGVNVRSAPRGLPYPATSLAECGATVTPEALFEALGEAWVEEEGAWDHGRGFAVIRPRWLEHAAGLGAPIAVGTAGETCRGTFETIDEEGCLVVRAADGATHRIAAGDVHFGAAATAVPA